MKEKILEAALVVYSQKGLKFTMDDIAAYLSISKKTIYKVFRDKDAMLLAMVDYVFDRIKESEKQVLESDLDIKEKLKMLLGVMPDNYKDIDFGKLYLLKDKYPAIYEKVQLRLESGWEETIALMEQGMEMGVFRRVNIPIFKLTFAAALEQFLSRDILVENGISYNDALKEVTELLVYGLEI